jgi:hypothetical protein
LLDSGANYPSDFSDRAEYKAPVGEATDLLSHLKEILIISKNKMSWMSNVPTTPEPDDYPDRSIADTLKTKALAYGFVALVFGIFTIGTILIPDPVPFVDEVGGLFVTAFASQKAIKQASN